MSTPDFDDLRAEFPEVTELLSGGLPELPRERPSEATWEAIESELRLPRRTSRLVDFTEEPTPAADDSGGSVHSITSARSWGRRSAILTAVAAAVLLFAVPLVIGLGGGGDAQFRADLAALSDFDGSGQAEIAGRNLDVRFDGSSAPDGSFYELWLLEFDDSGEEVVGLESLGMLEAEADGSFTIPDDVDLDRFDTVDVSIEPDDGNPDHSGESVLRGGLIEA